MPFQLFQVFMPLPGSSSIFYVFVLLTCLYLCVYVPSVLWHCWLGGRKGNRPVINWAVGCWHGFIFLVLAHPGSPRQRAVKRVCVCVVCVRAWLYTCITASEESLSCGLRLRRVLHASASPIDGVGVIMFLCCPSICVCIQSNPLKWIALGPDCEYLLRQNIHLSMFYTLHCVYMGAAKWYPFNLVIH